MNPDLNLLVRVTEMLEIHHENADGRWMRPEDLRRIIRLIVKILVAKENNE